MLGSESRERCGDVVDEFCRDKDRMSGLGGFVVRWMRAHQYLAVVSRSTREVFLGLKGSERKRSMATIKPGGEARLRSESLQKLTR